jgi:hypothetical protein
MKYEQVKHLKPGEFKRFWGVTYETFEKMVEIVALHSQQKKKTGRPGKSKSRRPSVDECESIGVNIAPISI